MAPHVRSGRWTSWSRSATTVIAAILQLILLVAPLTEIADGRLAKPAAVSAGGQLVVPGHRAPAAHNEATCPACVARSLHARLERLAAPLVLGVDECTPVGSSAARAPDTHPITTRHSRAPPVIA